MLKQYPLISIAISFVFGIIVQSVFQFSFAILCLCFTLAIIISTLVFKVIKKKLVGFPSFLVSLLPVFFLGMALFQFQNRNDIHYPISENIVKDMKAVGKVVEIDLRRESDLKFTLITDSLITAEKKVNGNYMIICGVKSSDKKKFLKLYGKLSPGNIVSVKGMYNKGKGIRNPGEFDYRAYLLKQGVIGFISVKDPDSVEILQSSTLIFPSLVFSIRKSIANRIEELQYSQANGLLKGLVLGDKSEIDSDVKMEFINSGVAHVLAVSGLHVGFIAIIFIILFGRANIYLRTILTVITLVFFLIITGFQAAALRATIMAMVIFAASLTNRDFNSWNTIAIAAIIILLTDVNQLFSPGFQLSFVAVISVVGLYPHFSNWVNSLKIKNKFVKALLGMFFLSMAAQIGVLPFTNYYFGKISVISLIANLFVIPGISFILANGLLTLFISVISMQAAYVFALAGDGLTTLLYWLIKLSATQDFSFIRVPNFTQQDAFIFYGFLLFLIFTLRHMQRMFTKLILILLVAANTIVFCSLDNKNLLPSDKLSVVMIDVGQGDSFLIRLPNGKTILIDGGNSQFNYDNGKRVIIPLLDYLGIAKIDYGFISHMDADHFAGFVSLVNQDRIEEIIKPDVDLTDKNDFIFEQLLHLKNVPYQYYREQKLIEDDVRIYTLCDTHAPPINTFKINDRSGILKIVYGKTSYLFVGDAQLKMENYLIKKWQNFLDVGVLKAGHHGSKTSSSENFINFVTPTMSLISVGEQNKFGHPSQVVLERLKESNSMILRTDYEGAVILQSDGNRIIKIDWKSF